MPSFLERWKASAKKLKLEVYALFLAYKDPRTPWYAKVFTAVVVAYAFSPIDLIPDPIPVFGYLDDLVLVPLGAYLAVKMIPRQVMEECREKSRQVMAQGKPVNKVAAVVIVLIWIGFATIVGILLYRWLASSVLHR
jgi:uncharacterized membrane protein YkvA (DUF1232 family)